MNDVFFHDDHRLYREIIFAVILLLVSGFIGIVFVQSALDKVFDRKGNQNWMEEQFKDCFLRNSIGLLLPVLTFFEMASGIISLVGIFLLLCGKGALILLCGFSLTGLTLLMLLFGQRVSKNYAGAVSLTGYFLIVLIGMLVLGMSI